LLKSKIQNPVTSSATRSDRLATGSFSEEQKFPRDLNTFSRAFKSCCNVRAGLLTFGFALHISEVIHSGATARDSHPLPYSPRFYAGHLNVC
jgi:hypothetical protein